MQQNQDKRIAKKPDGEEWPALDLQRFAAVPMTDIQDENDNPVFTTLGTADEDAYEPDADEDDAGVEEQGDAPVDPLFITRLNVTDQNLPQTAVGEMVVLDPDGALCTVSVDAEGALTESQFQLSTDNIEDGSIAGSKLEESTITARELDMESIFTDTTLLNQMVADNIDAEGLFENEGFISRFDDQVAQTAVLKEGGEMTGPLILSGDPKDANGAATRSFVEEAVAGDMPGNAASASRLQTARTIAIEGKVTGTATAFDGTQDIAIHTTDVDATMLDGRAASYYATAAQLENVQAQVNAAQSSADGKVSKAGDTMSGALTLSGNPTAANHAATKNYVDGSIQSAIYSAWVGLY